MLNEKLIANTRPIAKPDNVLTFNDYRITVLADRLFRVEKDENRVFNDEATQSVFFRDAVSQIFTSYVNDNKLFLTTRKTQLVVDGNDFAKSYAVVNGRNVLLTNEHNLEGTARTLDGCNGDIMRDGSKLKLDYGVCSKNGVAVLDDLNSLILKSTGELAPASNEQLDIYVFAYGNDYRGAVKALYQITGHTPLIPRFALGNWWSRYKAYTDKEYLSLMDKFAKADIPLTVATIDMDWHYSFDVDNEKEITSTGKNTPYYLGDESKWGIGWTGYSWNNRFFHNPKEFLKKLKDRGLKVTLNLHPAQGVRYYEDCYEKMANAMGIDASTEQHIPFDIADTRFINNYFDILHHPLEEQGVDFWWVDWQQGTSSKMEGLDPLWSLNHYHTLDKNNSNEQIILSRYCGVGAHRYPLGFTGDTIMSWNSLDYLPYFTVNASNIGYTWWSHDIGGHYNGDKNDERYLRYIQFAVFNPILRMHSTCNEVTTKEPWTFMNGIGELASKFLRLRHRLIPYLYSANYQTHKNGIALCEPLYYEYPNEKFAYRYKNEYLFGGQLLVAPITKPSQYKNLTQMRVWLPEGTWTDVFTGDIYQGGREIEIVRWLDSIPVFAKEGGIIPLAKYEHNNSIENPKSLELEVYNGKGVFELYEDLGEKSAITRFENSIEDKTQITEFYTTGYSNILPKNREYVFSYKNIGKVNSILVTANGVDVQFDYKIDDCLEITLKNIDFMANYKIKVCFESMSRIEYLRDRIKYSLLRLEGDTKERYTLHDELYRCESEEEFESLIEKSEFHKIYKIRLLEALLKGE